MKKFVLILISLVLASCISTRTSDDISSLKRSVDNLRSYQLDYQSNMDKMTEEVQKLKGRVEELEHYTEELRTNRGSSMTGTDLQVQPELIGDVASDKIIKGSGLNAIVPEDILSEDEVFASKQSIEFGREMLEMIENIKGNKFREALAIINDLMTIAQGEQQARVLFWQGICSDAIGNNKDALIAYNSLLTTYKNHPRAPMALYNQALVFLRLKDKNAAKLSLQKLMNEYPKSAYYQKAAEKMKDIR